MPNQLELTSLERPWLDECLPRAALLIPTMGEFTNHELKARLPKPSHVNYYGALWAKLKQAGLVKCAGFKTSKSKSRNGSAVRVWVAV